MILLAEQFVRTGKTLKPFKTKGHILLGLDYPYESLPPFENFIFLEIVKKPVPFFIEQLEQTGEKTLVVKLEDINNPEEALEICSLNVLTEKERINPDHEIFLKSFLHEFTLKDLQTGQQFPVVNWESGVAHDYLVINYMGSQRLIPFVDEWIDKIDRKARFIYMNLPEGIIENQK